ncbi:hypothetical protein GN244_ATG02129 [Phytophthora infestans]|uniref:Uncharacterized protein n=1 Tax=Phytophthora infestans TaxID=4787 RepID=A0A833ST35_PHYIN|nr:hypothetical protein GN244_ATG02129 [Phytophthora infestans]
MRNLSTTEL